MDKDERYEKLKALLKASRDDPFYPTDDGRQELAYKWARENGYFNGRCGVTSKEELDVACHHSMGTVLEFNDILVEKFGQDIADSVVSEYISRNN